MYIYSIISNFLNSFVYEKFVPNEMDNNKLSQEHRIRIFIYATIIQKILLICNPHMKNNNISQEYRIKAFIDRLQ